MTKIQTRLLAYLASIEIFNSF